jgi:hypothetical protein
VSRKAKAPLIPDEALVELARSEQPPVELDPYMGRFRAAGAVEVFVVKRTTLGTWIPTTAEEARAKPSEIVVRARRFMAFQTLEWQASATPVSDALKTLVETGQRYDDLTRFLLAAEDMRIAAHAAASLIDAHEKDGPARLYERVIETGMVVTYVRPFLESNEAGLGRKWWPPEGGPDRELFDELVELRHKYHVHAAHTPRRHLVDTTQLLGLEGRPIVSESWEQLRTNKLRALEELATRQASLFAAEAERHEVALFGRED